MIGKRYKLKRLTNDQMTEIGPRNLDCNVNDVIKRHGKDSVWEVVKTDKDNTSYIKLVSDRDHKTWVDNVSLVPEPIHTQTDLIGNGVGKVLVTNYTFENQVYNDKNQVLGVLLNRVPAVHVGNFTEVLKRLNEIEKTWNKM